MVFAAHPPTYLPDRMFFRKMCHSDVFVLADTLRYSRRSESSRTRIKSDRGALTLTVPVYSRGRAGQRLASVEIVQQSNWRRKHWRALSVCYQYAAYFDKYADFFEQLYRRTWRSLLELNLAGIDFLRRQLGLATRVVLLSELDERDGPDLIVRLAERLACDTYLCEPRFRAYLESTNLKRSGLRVQFLPEAFPVYHQLFGTFVPNLSVVDVLFNEGDEAVQFVRIPEGSECASS